MGVGAFTSALLVTRAGVPFWLSVPPPGSSPRSLGLLFGMPSVRIKGLYLAIATLAAQVIIEWALSRPAVAGTGVRGRATPDGFQDDRAYYFVVLTVAVLAVVFAENVLRTRIGRALVAVRDQDIAAAVIGVDVARYKLLAFGLSSFYAGIAGALLGHLGQAVNFEQFQLDLSIQYLAMIVIGGLGSIPGSLFRRGLHHAAADCAARRRRSPRRRAARQFGGVLSSAQYFLFGLVIVAFMVVEPQGLARIWRTSRPSSGCGRFRTDRFPGRPLGAHERLERRGPCRPAVRSSLSLRM